MKSLTVDMKLHICDAIMGAEEILPREGLGWDFSEFSAMVDQPLRPPSWCTCPGNNDQCLVLPCCPRAVCLLSPHSTVPGHSSSFLGDATHTKCCEQC